MNTGTVKSIERQHGTGSIAPDKSSDVRSDTGFTRDAIGEPTFDALRMGERVRFEADRDPERSGYANATWLESIEPDRPSSDA